MRPSHAIEFVLRLVDHQHDDKTGVAELPPPDCQSIAMWSRKSKNGRDLVEDWGVQCSHKDDQTSDRRESRVGSVETGKCAVDDTGSALEMSTASTGVRMRQHGDRCCTEAS